MKFCELIYREEYVYSEADEEAEIECVTTRICDINERTLLIVQNSKKAPNLSEAACLPYAVVCDGEYSPDKSVRTVRVENPRLCAAMIFSRFYRIDYSKMKFIGVTGTNGKTSTATFIKHILTKCGKRVGFIGTGKIESQGVILSDENYSMTTPDPELLYKCIATMQARGCDTVVMEVSSHSLALHKVDAIHFDYGVFTNLSGEHADFHKSKEAYFEAKKRLFSMCERAVINLDDKYGRRLASECPVPTLTVGALYRGDVFASDVKRSGFEGVSYLYHGRDFIFRARLSLLGIYNVYNSALACAVCIDMGLLPCEVKSALLSLKKIEGRFEIIKGRPAVIIDYAHTDFAFENLLKDLTLIKGRGPLTVVFGCGGERDREKRPRTAAAVEKYADKIIVTSDNSRGEAPMDIIADIIRGFKEKPFTIIEDREMAIREAILSSPDDGTIAIIGKGAEKYNIDKTGYHSFDEKAIIERALDKRKRRLRKS